MQRWHFSVFFYSSPCRELALNQRPQWTLHALIFLRSNFTVSLCNNDCCYSSTRCFCLKRFARDISPKPENALPKAIKTWRRPTFWGPKISSYTSSYMKCIWPPFKKVTTCRVQDNHITLAVFLFGFIKPSLKVTLHGSPENRSLV